MTFSSSAGLALLFISSGAAVTTLPGQAAPVSGPAAGLLLTAVCELAPGLVELTLALAADLELL